MSGPGSTERVQEVVTPLKARAVMVQLPWATATTSPASFTVATAGLSLAKLA